MALDAGLPRGLVFAPFHWNDATSRLARVDALAQAQVDPISGQPELKATPVQVTPLAMACEGFLVSRSRIELPDWLQQTRLAVPGGEAVLFASTRDAASLAGLLANHLGEAPGRVEIGDAAEGDFRTILFSGDRLELALVVQARRDAPMLDWIVECFGREGLDAEERKAVLAGCPPAGTVPRGALVCSCFGVRHDAIAEAVRNGALSVEAVGELLKAGTNCGSCRPEIKRVIVEEGQRGVSARGCLTADPATLSPDPAAMPRPFGGLRRNNGAAAGRSAVSIVIVKLWRTQAGRGHSGEGWVADGSAPGRTGSFCGRSGCSPS